MGETASDFEKIVFARNATKDIILIVSINIILIRNLGISNPRKKQINDRNFIMEDKIPVKFANVNANFVFFCIVYLIYSGIRKLILITLIFN